MIIYAETLETFFKQCDSDYIEEVLLKQYKLVTNRSVGKREIESWKNSLAEIEKILYKSTLKRDVYILLEFRLPASEKRLDVMLLGKNENNENNAVIIELKQWQEALKTDEDAVVKTFLNGKLQETVHPSYQAYSYMKYLQNFHGAFHDDKIKILPLAYLHNFKIEEANHLLDIFYKKYINIAPIFFRRNKGEIINLIERKINNGDGEAILQEIDSAKVFPSKKLADTINSLLEGNEEFTLLDEQKIAFEKVKSIYKKNKNNKNIEKHVILIKGGAGTGKSVIGVNLLRYFLSQQTYVQYITPNQSFREVLKKRITPKKEFPEIRNLFQGSGIHVNSVPDDLDVIICDEAHRLKEHGFMQAKIPGENQIIQLIKAAKIIIFFVDDNQLVSKKDIGTYDLIKKTALNMKINTYELELNSQFRCNGSDNYIEWLEDVFSNRKNKIKKQGDFDFQVVDDPNILKAKVVDQLNGRIVAGYAWKWNKERKNGELQKDVIIEKYNFKLPWNDNNRIDWAIREECKYQIGCIHTVQGSEFDVVGVIIGDDLYYDKVSKILKINRDKYMDTGSKPAKPKKDEDDPLKQQIFNTYKTLMTRGMKACYVYCCNDELKEYLKKCLE